nr:MAG TPA: hypothetical protein [Caudoviricetes sp.]
MWARPLFIWKRPRHLPQWLRHPFCLLPVMAWRRNLKPAREPSNPTNLRTIRQPENSNAAIHTESSSNSGRLKTQKPPYKGGLYSYFQTIA